MFIYDDNFLTEEEILDIEKAFFSGEIAWAFFPYTQGRTDATMSDVDHPGVVDVKIKDIPYFSAGIRESSSVMPKFKYIIDKMCQKHGIAYNKLGRVKLNATPWSENGNHLYPHVDKDYNTQPHLIFLYYINDSDGDTVLFDQKYTGDKIGPESLTVMKRVTPKRGSAFIVSGEHFHAISPPTKNSMRCVINANLDLY